MFFFFFKQKTAYEMRISDWSSDVCSSDLVVVARALRRQRHLALNLDVAAVGAPCDGVVGIALLGNDLGAELLCRAMDRLGIGLVARGVAGEEEEVGPLLPHQELHQRIGAHGAAERRVEDVRSEEHTSELQSLMRISYAVFCLKTKNATHL